MKYSDFMNIMSQARMSRYLASCQGKPRKAMTLYRRNLQLSQELFTVISCFEVALRNAIDKIYLMTFGNDWLRNAALPGGIFANPGCRKSSQVINDEIAILGRQYSHVKLIAEMGFGFWRYFFSPNQYRAGGQTLLQLFSSRPASGPTIQHNASYVFNELAKINQLRNRIAHHEPICFVPGQSIKDTSYARQHYALVLQFFQWMSIDEGALLYGLDHITETCDQIDRL